MFGVMPAPAAFYCFGQEQGGRLMGVAGRWAAAPGGTSARAEAEELRGRTTRLAERLAQVEERLSRLVIAREVVDEVLGGTAAEAPSKARTGPRKTSRACHVAWCAAAVVQAARYHRHRSGEAGRCCAHPSSPFPAQPGPSW